MTEPIIYAASWLINPDTPPIESGAVLVSGGIVRQVGTLRDLQRNCLAKVLEFPDCVIIPGFVNAHTHLELTHFPSWRASANLDYNPQSFVDWIIQLIKIKHGLTAEDYQASLLEGVKLCLKAGTTVVGDIITNPLLAKLYSKTALAGRLYFELLGHEQKRFQNLLKMSLEECKPDISKLQIESGLSPHSTYTIGESNFHLINQAASSCNLPLAVHLSESAEELDFISESIGEIAEKLYPFVQWHDYLPSPRRCSPTKLLDKYSLLMPSTMAIHCVHVTLADAKLLKQRGVSIVLCPRSNDKLDVGQAPAELFKKLGIPLALGTDSLASNNSLSLWDEIRFALSAFQSKLLPTDLFRMSTIGGALALGLSNSNGSLEAAKRADFQVISNAGNNGNNLLERVLSEGVLKDVYVAGELYK